MARVFHSNTSSFSSLKFVIDFKIHQKVMHDHELAVSIGNSQMDEMTLKTMQFLLHLLFFLYTILLQRTATTIRHLVY